MKKREVSLFVLLAIVLLPFITGCYKREMPDDIRDRIESIKELPRDQALYGAWFHENININGGG